MIVLKHCSGAPSNRNAPGYHVGALILSIFLAGSAGAQATRKASTLGPVSTAAALVEAQLRDTSFIRRAVARERLRSASSALRREAAGLFAFALRDSSRQVRNNALNGIGLLGNDAAAVVPTVAAIAIDAANPARNVAVNTLRALGPVAREGLPQAKLAASDTNEAFKILAANAVLAIGDTAFARNAYRELLRSPRVNIRLNAARSLADLADTAAVAPLQSFLKDTAVARRLSAATGLGSMGAKAARAIPDLVAMLSDTVPRRVAQGAASEEESPAAYAAWALAQVIPFRANANNAVIDPLRARVEGPNNSLRGDGLGDYVWGADSVAVWRASGFFLHMVPPNDFRGPIGPANPALRRSLAFDLSRPVGGSGARSLGVVRDNAAYIWIWYRRDPATDRIITFRTLGVSDSVYPAERIEMHFRIGGILHILQMGPFVEGQGGGADWYTGFHGAGTSIGQLTHPGIGSWIVRAPPGSVARLWSFEDRTKPVDRGLYNFTMQIRFTDFPGGARGSCVPRPESCK
jgi:hypothetical protein